MPKSRLLPCTLSSIYLIISGCTSYEITPKSEPSQDFKNTTQAFSFKIDTPYKSSAFGRDLYEATKEILTGSVEVSEKNKEAGEIIAINVSELSPGDACAQDYLTGLTLGIIPSWCIRPAIYKFKFELSHNNHLCASKTYAINSTSFTHIILLPFALLGEIKKDNRPLALYKEALSSFSAHSKCEQLKLTHSN